MTQLSTAPGAGVEVTGGARAGRLLTCGIVAGPIFVLVAGVQVLTRDGFDLRRHAISMLSLGGPGWIQITNFVLTGLLTVACAVGMRRVLRGGRAGTWAPLLVGGYGVGLVSAGFFTPDPGVGFPPGAPAGMPAMTWHSLVHAVSGTGAFVSLIVAAFLLARRYAAAGQRAWAGYCAGTGIVTIPLVMWPSTAGAGIRLAIAAVLAWTLIAATAARLRSSTPDRGGR
jgi:hypothetical membrane protein